LSKTSSVSLNISDKYHSVTRIVLFNIRDFMKGNAMIRHVFIVLILVMPLVSCGVPFVDVPIVPGI
jgi:hypothetical protein